MKSVLSILVLVLAATTACSSKPKATEEVKPQAPIAAPTKTEAAPAVTKATDDKIKKSKKSKAAKNSAADSSATVPADSKNISCSKGSDQRTIEIKAKGDGCEVIYTKNGQGQSVASEIKGMSHCEQVSQKIAKKLTDSGMACK